MSLQLKMNQRMWIFVLITFNSFQQAVSNDCSQTNLDNNIQLCLNSIWAKANDNGAFWFGTQWQSICGLNPLKAPYCTSLQQPYSPHSLLNTVYGLDFDHSQNPLTKYLYITYHTETGSYDSCGNTYHVTETKTFDLEPLLSKNYYPWDTKTMPTITWTPSENTLYTLIIFDAGAYISHGVFINIEGNDLANSEVIRSYNGPKNPSIREQPYVFLLYEQSNRKNLSDEWRQKLSQGIVRESYNFTDVFQELQLNGPIAMNWVQVVKDPYSIQFFVTMNIINNCPNMITDALKSKSISFIPVSVDLSLTMDIEIHTKALSFESCCTTYRYTEHTAKLNPIGDGYISPGRSRSDAVLTMKLQREGILYIPSTSTAIYTLICIDISVPNPAAGTADLPLLHMLIININGSDIDTGDVIHPYRGPAPPDYTNHTYMFLLYTQDGLLTENDTSIYMTQDCPDSLIHRCLFNVTRFTDGINLHLVGANWFLATTDEYTRYGYLNRGNVPDIVCENIDGYGNPCPVGLAPLVSYSFCLMLSLLLFSYVFFSL